MGHRQVAPGNEPPLAEEMRGFFGAPLELGRRAGKRRQEDVHEGLGEVVEAAEEEGAG